VHIGPPLHGKTLAEAGLRDRYRVNVVLLTRPGSKETTQALEPEPELKLALNDLLNVAGLRENMNKFERECGLPE
jgi:Trk K+ transport system NAD-binding subunit